MKPQESIISKVDQCIDNKTTKDCMSIVGGHIYNPWWCFSLMSSHALGSYTRWSKIPGRGSKNPVTKLEFSILLISSKDWHSLTFFRYQIPFNILLPRVIDKKCQITWRYVNEVIFVKTAQLHSCCSIMKDWLNISVKSVSHANAKQMDSAVWIQNAKETF